MRKLLTIIATMTLCNAYGIDVYWINGTSGSSTTCTSGGNITKPSNPTKTGYRFIGWKNVTATYNFANFDQYTAATSYTPDTDFNYKKDWTATFSYGTVYGTHLCSITTGSIGDSDYNPSTAQGYNCWCKLITYIDNSGTVYLPNKTLPWSKTGDFTTKTYDFCEQACARSCGLNMTFSNASGSIEMRRVMFGK